jgi:purine-binding chemotaxis protein CheW
VGNFFSGDDDMDEGKSADVVKQFLTFKVGNELYGIEVENVREVIEFSDITLVPKTPDYINGIINLRGEVVPIVNLPVLFYHQYSEVTKFTCIVIIEVSDESEKYLIGTLIDAVSAVVDLTDENIEETPDFGIKIRADYTSGVGKLGDKFIILLNIDSILDIDDLADFTKARSFMTPVSSGTEEDQV